MDAKPRAGIYLFVQFNWPPNFTKEMAEAAKALHLAVEKADWIQETLAASGGLGSGPANWWVFWMADYASLDRLLHGGEDAVSLAYGAFFTNMVDVSEAIREQVVFL
jgi:hypothetical protein